MTLAGIGVRGQRPAPPPRPLPTYPPGRRCAEEGCPTTLSRYNGGDRCWAHQAPEPRAADARSSASARERRPTADRHARRLLAVRLRLVEGRSLREVALALGIGENSAYQLVRRWAPLLLEEARRAGPA
ncbi:MAG TPA: helix-turn-helix domain-containing protein [Actinomycetota bacterium]|nr:helix-turn-helix domain-containing protein [Actinomycetota bacterium]